MPDERTRERMRNLLRNVGQILLTDAMLFDVRHIDVFCRVDDDHTYFCASVFDKGWEDVQVVEMEEFE